MPGHAKRGGRGGGGGGGGGGGDPQAALMEAIRARREKQEEKARKIEAGELEFCAGVSYDVCSRVVSPTAYDEELQAAHDERVARYTMEWPSLATSECFAAFKMYLCLLSFPRCDEDSQNPGTYFEIPLCYDYCVNAHATCGSPAEKSQAACALTQ